MRTKYIRLDDALDLLHDKEVVMTTPIAARRLIAERLIALHATEIESVTHCTAVFIKEKNDE